MPFLPPKNQKLRYFAASNSAGGFKCYYDDIFPPQKFERLYIIKGGPGTGKSYLMQRAASEAEKAGYTVEYFYCSSDPLSLDGITAYPKCDENDLFGKKHVPRSFAIIDGTAPHTRDTMCPGAADEIINLGDFWNTGVLKEKRAEIEQLSGEKSECFTRAYEYLQAANELAEQTKRLTSPLVNHGKMNSALGRIFKGIKPGKGFVSAPRPQRAISMSGNVEFDTFNKSAEFNYYITECADTAHLLFDEIMNFARQKQLVTVYSPSPLCGKYLDGIYLPSEGISFTLCDSRPDIENNEKIINMERFVDMQEISQKRTRLRLSKKYREAMLNSALECLADAHREHFTLEKIYISAMDFDKKENASAGLLTRILT